MAEKEVIQDDTEITVEDSVSKISKNIEANSKSYGLIGVAIVAVLGIYFAYTQLYLKPLNEDAKKEMFFAEQHFAQDSLRLAMYGDAEGHIGFEEIIEKYGLTQSGNLANYYMGISLLRTGEYEKAIEHLDNFSSDDEMLGPIAEGAIGDAYSELGQTEKAAAHYMKAAEKKKNNFTTPIYLMRAGLAYEDLNNFDKAIDVYQLIFNEYKNTTEGRDVEKYLARAKAKAGKF